MNTHLDELQNDLIKELMAVEQRESSKIQKLLTTLRRKEKEITEFQANIFNIKKHASELQIFLAMKHYEKDIAQEEKFVQSLTKSDTMSLVNISCQINKSLQEITDNVQKFGEIKVNSDPCNFSIQKRKHKQAQIMVALPTRNIDNLTVTLQKRIDTKLSNVRGCCIFPDGRMVFSCYTQDKIRLFKSDGSNDFDINNNCTFDVVFIGDDCIAVTSGNSYKIDAINTKNNTLEKKIAVKSDSDGAVYKDGHLIYCAKEKGLQMLNLSNESITNVTKNKLSSRAYVTTFGEKLFYTNKDIDSVTCCDYHGNILWTFCDSSVLSIPLGISVDNYGNVFVLGYDTNNVVVISPDGQRFRQLLSRDDGLNGPQVLHYDQLTNKLLVANYRETAFLYEVK